MKIAVIFHRLGPYHFARLRAAGRLLPVTAIETSGADETYAWDLIAGADGFERMTLFGNADAQRQPAREVASRVGSALDKIMPAVVAIPGWADSAALAALQWCGRKQVPAVAMSESTEWDETRAPWKEWMKRRIVGLFSAALVGGHPHKDYMVKLGMSAERVFLGYDAVDNGYFEGKTVEVRNQESEVRKRHGLPERYFLASARFVEMKNLSRLIQAYALYRKKVDILKARNGNRKSEIWDLVLLGDGDLRESLRTLRSALGLDTCVHLPGFKQYPDLPAYYGLAKTFIHASTKEPWGLVVNEAMASGLPVLISNRCGCATDLVREGVNGFAFDPRDVEGMAKLMLKASTFDSVSSPPPRPVREIQGEVSNFDSDPSSTLEQMGAASARIISNWGTERFAAALKAAAEKAAEDGPQRANLTDRWLLGGLLFR